jgi:integrase-like protein
MFERDWRPAVTSAKIPDFRFHDLRHTFASRLAMRGVDLYTVQRAGRKGWCARQGSNLRPSDSKSDALSN